MSHLFQTIKSTISSMKKWVFSPRVALGNVDSDDEFEEPRFNKKRAKKRKLDNSPPPPPIKEPSLLSDDLQPVKEEVVENRQANGLNISNGIGSTHTVIEIIDSDDEFEELHCNKKPTKRQKLDYSPPPQQIKEPSDNLQPVKEEDKQTNGLLGSNGIGGTHTDHPWTDIEIIDSNDELEELHFSKKHAKEQRLDYSPPPLIKEPSLLSDDLQPVKKEANNNHGVGSGTLTDIELDGFSNLTLTETAPGGQPYDDFQREVLSDVLAHETSGLCLNDFLNILDSGITRNRYIPGAELLTIIRRCYDWQVDCATASVFALLLKDLAIRPIQSGDLVEIFDFCVEKFGSILSPHSSNNVFLTPVHLTLQYLEKALVLCQKKPRIIASFYKDLGRCGMSQLVTLVVQVVNHIHRLSSPSGDLGIDILAHLQLLTCLGLCSCESEEEREELALSIATAFSSQISQLQSLDKMKMLFDSLPSDLVREKVLDIYLDKEYILHSSTTQFKKTEQFSGSGSSLAKFCCVHLCRTPYLHSGELHNPSYFIHLLASLLQSILSLKMGGPFLSSPQLECSAHKALSSTDKSLRTQETLRSHITHLIDRLSEDEIVLSYLGDHQCWSYLALLGNLPDILNT